MFILIGKHEKKKCSLELLKRQCPRFYEFYSSDLIATHRSKMSISRCKYSSNISSLSIFIVNLSSTSTHGKQPTSTTLRLKLYFSSASDSHDFSFYLNSKDPGASTSKNILYSTTNNCSILSSIYPRDVCTCYYTDTNPNIPNVTSFSTTSTKRTLDRSKLAKRA